jgi:hypothetical protein
MTKKVTFGTKPVVKTIDQNQWVENRAIEATEKIKRMTFDISESLHRRIKSQCAIKGVKMADEIRDLLERNFPNEN